MFFFFFTSGTGAYLWRELICNSHWRFKCFTWCFLCLKTHQRSVSWRVVASLLHSVICVRIWFCFHWDFVAIPQHQGLEFHILTFWLQRFGFWSGQTPQQIFWLKPAAATTFWQFKDRISCKSFGWLVEHLLYFCVAKWKSKNRKMQANTLGQSHLLLTDIALWV